MSNLFNPTPVLQSLIGDFKKFLPHDTHTLLDQCLELVYLQGRTDERFLSKPTTDAKDTEQSGNSSS